jgi:hypothetical protein
LYGTSITKASASDRKRQITQIWPNAPPRRWSGFGRASDDLVAGDGGAGAAHGDDYSFAREVLRGKEGDAKRYLEERAIEMSATGALRNPRRYLGSPRPTTTAQVTGVPAIAGLYVWTPSIFIDYAIDATLDALARAVDSLVGRHRCAASPSVGLASTSATT